MINGYQIIKTEKPLILDGDGETLNIKLSNKPIIFDVDIVTGGVPVRYIIPAWKRGNDAYSVMFQTDGETGINCEENEDGTYSVFAWLN